MLGALVQAGAAADAVFGAGGFGGVVVVFLQVGGPIAMEAVLVPDVHHGGDIHPRRAGHTIAAGGAGHELAGAKDLQRFGQRGLLGGGEGHKGVHGGNVVLHLLPRAHAGQHAQHPRQAGRPADGPAGQAALRRGGAQNFGGLGAQGVEHTAPHRFHHNDLQPGGGAELVFFPAVLVIPVKIVELELDKIPVPGGQNLPQQRHAAVEGEPQPLDAPGPAHCVQLVVGVIFDIVGPAALMDRVDQIKVKIIGAAVFQLLGKDAGHIRVTFQEPAGQLAGQMVALPGIFTQRLAAEFFRHFAMVGVGGVKIVDAVGVGVVKNFPGLLLIDAGGVGGVPQRQTHGAKTQQADFSVRVVVRRRVMAGNTVFHGGYSSLQSSQLPQSVSGAGSGARRPARLGSRPSATFIMSAHSMRLRNTLQPYS